MSTLNPFIAERICREVDPSSPLPRDPPLQTLSTFRFTSLAPSPDTLNCTVIGPGGDICYYLVTDAHSQGCTLLKSAIRQPIAIIEWRSQPTLEAHGIVPRQRVGEWLRLSPERRLRTMVHNGVCYFWKRANLSLHLCAPTSPEWFARATRTHDAVTLELTPGAIERGLTSAAVLATALMQCGRAID